MAEFNHAWHQGMPGSSAGRAPIQLKVQRVEQVTARALERYNRNLHKARGRSVQVVKPRHCDLKFLMRITDNFIRHCLSDYDAVVVRLAVSVGYDRAGEIGHRLAAEAIDAVYPELIATRRRLTV